MYGVVEGHNGDRFGRHLVEGIILSYVAAITYSADYQYGHVLLFARIEHAAGLHLCHAHFVMKVLGPVEVWR